MAPAQRALTFTGGAMRPAGNVPWCSPPAAAPARASPALLRHKVLPAPGGQGEGTQVQGWSRCPGVVPRGGLTHHVHAELPLVPGLVGGGVQDEDVELGEEPHVLAGEGADVPRPAGLAALRGNCARRGHVPEEQMGSSSTPWLGPGRGEGIWGMAPRCHPTALHVPGRATSPPRPTCCTSSRSGSSPSPPLPHPRSM